jgi:hypothetical protein
MISPSSSPSMVSPSISPTPQPSCQDPNCSFCNQEEYPDSDCCGRRPLKPCSSDSTSCWIVPGTCRDYANNICCFPPSL